MVAWWGKRGRGARIALISATLIAALLAVGVFTQRELIRSLLRGTNFVPLAPGDASLTLPAGFRADVFASGLSAPRFMTAGPDGALLVTERASGNIVALRDPNGTGKATEKTVIASGLEQPTSVDYVDGNLYVGETSRITRFSLDSALKASDKTALIPDLPT